MSVSSCSDDFDEYEINSREVQGYQSMTTEEKIFTISSVAIAILFPLTFNYLAIASGLFCDVFQSKKIDHTLPLVSEELSRDMLTGAMSAALLVPSTVKVFQAIGLGIMVFAAFRFGYWGYQVYNRYYTLKGE